MHHQACLLGAHLCPLLHCTQDADAEIVVVASATQYITSHLAMHTQRLPLPPVSLHVQDADAEIVVVASATQYITTLQLTPNAYMCPLLLCMRRMLMLR
jgi:hypothetical protein